MQCHSLAVIHSQKCDETAFYKCATCHSHAVSHRKRCDETALPKMCNATHLLLFIAKDMMRLTFTNVQCHSHTVNHKKRCDETAFHKMMSLTPCWRCDETGFYKMSNVTHSLLVIGKYVMRLPSTKIFKCAHLLSVIWKKYIEQHFRIFAMLLTNCWP